MFFKEDFISQIRHKIVRLFVKQTKLSSVINNNEIIIIDSNNSSQSSITCFEDLSNEIIYEIFDFLDFCHVYTAFSNLNIRFKNLLTDPTLPIKINLSSISKSTFQYYHTQIIIPNEHRIKSLHLSNIFINELIFSPCSLVLNLNRLEKLVLNNIESKYLEELLHYFISLTCLSSITINCKYDIQEKNNYYSQLIQFPALKYCNVSLEGYIESVFLPIATNQFSPIEYLVINGFFSPEDINALLSYLPQLRRLSVHHLCKLNNRSFELYSTRLNYLTHVDLSIMDIIFDEFELMVKNLFYKLEVLHISTNDHKTYLRAKKWERLIISSMPYLRIFDIKISCALSSKEYIKGCIVLFNQFCSSFWFERQWFFGYYVYKNINPEVIHKGYYFIFYSTNPYKRKTYMLGEKRYENMNPNGENDHINSVDHLEIQDEKAIINCAKYFPNASELTLCYFDQFQHVPPTILNSIIPLKQLTKLVIVYCNGSFSKIIELLCCTPNLHTFSINPKLCIGQNIELCQPSEAFQLISKTNNITKLNIIDECRLEEVNYLVHLCPRLQHITLIKVNDQLESILLFLLSKDNDKISHLHSICIQTWCETYFEKVKSLLKSENLFDVSSIMVGQLIFSRIYLWW